MLLALRFLGILLLGLRRNVEGSGQCNLKEEFEEYGKSSVVSLHNTILDQVVYWDWKPCRSVPSADKEARVNDMEIDFLSNPPSIFYLFDWVLFPLDGNGEVKFVRRNRTRDPETVLIYPRIDILDALVMRIGVLKKLDVNGKRSLVIAGSEKQTTRKFKTLLFRKLRSFFSNIWATSKGKMSSPLRIVPVGLDAAAIIKAGIEQVSSIVNGMRHRTYTRRNLVLEEVHEDDKQSKGLKASSSIPLPWLAESSYEATMKHWKLMANFKYSVCAPYTFSRNVQNPKIFEAMLMRSVPITLSRPAFVDLKSMGFPILLVNKWTDLNSSFLVDEYERQFMGIDWESVRNMLKPQSIMEMILRSNNSLQPKKKIASVPPNANVKKKKRGKYKINSKYSSFFQRNDSVVDGTVLSWVLSFDWSPCTENQTITDPYLQNPPQVFKHFDWIVWSHDEKKNLSIIRQRLGSNPRFVLLKSSSISLQYLADMITEKKLVPISARSPRRSLVIAGGTVRLKGHHQKIIHEIFLDYFSDIWVSAKDVEDSFVQSIPLGLSTLSVVKAGIHKITSIVEEMRLHFDSEQKRKLAVAAIDVDKIAEGGDRLSVYSKSIFARSWLDTLFVNTSSSDYMKELSKYKFTLFSSDAGIQPPLLAEALLMHSIPVVLRESAFEDLRQMGLPILIVSRWTDVSSDYLENEYANQFRNVHWEQVSRLFESKYVMDLISNWKSPIPSRSKSRDETSRKILQRNGAYLPKCRHDAAELKSVMYKDSNTNPFEGTILNEVVNFPWRPCLEGWRFQNSTEKNSYLRFPPSLFKHFDWIIWYHQRRKLPDVLKQEGSDPRLVLVHPAVPSMAHLAKMKQKLHGGLRRLRPNQKRSLVIAGDDHNFVEATQRIVHVLFLGCFSDVWVTAKDAKDPYVQTIPVGLNAYYIVKGGIHSITSMVTSLASRRIRREKQGLVVAAWGSVWSHLDKELLDRMTLVAYLNKPSTMKWLRRSNFDMLDYWKSLERYKYSICPPGAGIQTPKVFEAMLMETVPITLRRPAFEDLEALGFPILLVEKWDDINEAFLDYEYEKRYRDTNWTRVRNMLKPESVIDMIMSWNSTIPTEPNYRWRQSKKILDNSTSKIKELKDELNDYLFG